MALYETVLIARQDLAADDVDALVSKLEKIITEGLMRIRPDMVVDPKIASATPAAIGAPATGEADTLGEPPAVEDAAEPQALIPEPAKNSPESSKEVKE